LFVPEEHAPGEALVEMPQPREGVTLRKDAGQSQWLRSLVMEKPQVKIRGVGG
jgi:hypothetical protein